MKTGAPCWIRTSDPQLRRLLLYPTELRARIAIPLVVVGAPGLEPGASCTQNKRATRLRHAPNARTLPQVAIG
ncbi:hypothetical protein AA102526_1690 [Asaia lannensis NBRC 102526]|nr:hypothetical protein AA102526_1690 [Asaia lannensis NBRC 102526]